MSAHTCKSTSHLGTLLISANRIVADYEIYDIMEGGNT
jgi:hypothetical protein